MKNIFYITVIALLFVTTLFFWHRSSKLGHRLELIQDRIEQSKKVRIDAEKFKPETPRYKARLAIVLDDFGYNLNNLEEVWELGVPITLSILPNLTFSKAIARAAGNRGIEHILHLPLEPYETKPLERSTIMTTMTEEEILNNLERAIASVPGLKGISSHMGSKATEDERVMSLIFDRMRKDNLYFLDSLVTNKSVCRYLCKKIGLKFAKRSVFLDNEADAEYITGQIKELARQALATDWAIGIGHDRPLTIAAIREMLPELDKMGVEFVFLSELTE
ncbi:MAG: divergent polysaccharide deacetylase family protein [Candidatus Omnitrophica bacterium]|nr:divergent polysaccharide deacetylase family protein [Candidatus Omnitrophota bacterium]